MDERRFKERTRRFALAVINIVSLLPKNEVTFVIRRQLLRSATSVGANYRAACRGRSVAEVLSKLGIVEEEADESAYWLELLIDAKLIEAGQVLHLIDEISQITAMTVASIKTLRSKL